MKTPQPETWAVVQKSVRGWAQISNQVHDAYIAIADAIAGGAIALSERCSSSFYDKGRVTNQIDSGCRNYARAKKAS